MSAEARKEHKQTHLETAMYMWGNLAMLFTILYGVGPLGGHSMGLHFINDIIRAEERELTSHPYLADNLKFQYRQQTDLRRAIDRDNQIIDLGFLLAIPGIAVALKDLVRKISEPRI